MRRQNLAFNSWTQGTVLLVSKQNHVVFGRRGAGKTLLLNAAESSNNHLHIYLNMEDYKDITFPNILINVLIAMLSSVDAHVKTVYPWYKFNRKAKSIRKRIAQISSLLRDYYHQPDREVQQVSTTEAYDQEFSLGASAENISADVSQKTARAREVKRNLPKNKLQFLRLELSTYKTLITDISPLFSGRPIFLVLDDFYFVPKETQPELVDYLHRLTKGTGLYLKLATIKYRSKLYVRPKGRFVGVELGHDILEIDMDYTLDNFDELKSFMRRLLDNAVAGCNLHINLDELFAGDGFSQLCLASGGVPRDFLTLFVKLGEKTLAKGETISKLNVTDVAILNAESKIDGMNRDSGRDTSVLEEYLEGIRKIVFDQKRTNAFLVAKDELDSNPQFKQAIHELIDLRLIHILDQNTSRAPSDGLRYEAYILDVGLYNNPRQIGFTQIEPGRRDEKSRKDDIRASPTISIAAINELRAQPRSSGSKPVSKKQEPETRQLTMTLE